MEMCHEAVSLSKLIHGDCGYDEGIDGEHSQTFATPPSHAVFAQRDKKIFAYGEAI